jgi:hypothetical protein
MNYDLTFQLNRILSGMQPGTDTSKIIFKVDIGSYKREIIVVRYGDGDYAVEVNIRPKNNGEFADAKILAVFTTMYFRFSGNCISFISEFLGCFRLDYPEAEITLEGNFDLIGTIK